MSRKIDAQSGMRLVLVSEDHSAVAGGVSAVVDQLSRRASAAGIQTDLLFVRDRPMHVPPEVSVHHVPPSTLGRLWGWSPKLRPALEGLASGDAPTVFHVHGVWMAPQFLAARAGAEKGVPFVLSAHGMLQPWLWKCQGWRKRIKKQAYWRCVSYPALRKANVIHAISPLERDSLVALFPGARIEIIPNAVDPADFPGAQTETPREPMILFLGRIEPRKGVHLLLHAFARARLSREWRLCIVGPVWSEVYRRELDRIVVEHGIGDRVSFTGALFGNEKLTYLRRAWVMAAPSYSEVVGLVNLEAAMSGTSSITTRETGLYDWAEGGGLLIHPDVDELRDALETACAWSGAERDGRGQASRDLVMRRYSWGVVLPMWIDLYGQLASKNGVTIE